MPRRFEPSTPLAGKLDRDRCWLYIAYLARDDFLIDVHVIGRIERRVSGSHLVDENSC